MFDSPLMQVIVSLIILLLMGYFAYNIYLMEFEKMLSTSSDIRKEVNVIKGIYDYKINNEVKFDTYDKSKTDYLDISPSINQQGGAEYSYNFWLYLDKNKLNAISSRTGSDDKKDIVLFLKGEKKIYYSPFNKNCSTKTTKITENANVFIKNPLVKLKHDGSAMTVEFNNIYNPDSYQKGANMNNCKDENSTDWNTKNRNLVGIYDLDFNNRWFMVTIIMKEVADSNNIMIKNRASCKMYINGINVLDKHLETEYSGNLYSATFKNNKSPFYLNPDFNNLGKVKDDFKRYNNNNLVEENTLKIADLKYYNYALKESDISELFSNGFTKNTAIIEKKDSLTYYQVTDAEMEKNKIKEI
jgi:hypothetical protein